MALPEMAVLAISAEAEVVVVLHLGHQELCSQEPAQQAAADISSSSQSKEKQ
jgi:hypothetical protein